MVADPEELSRLWGGISADVDQPDASPEEVYDSATLVVTGTVQEVGLGSIQRDSPEDAFADDRLAIRIEVETVDKGGDLVETGDEIWLDSILGIGTIGEAQEAIAIGLPITILANPTPESTPAYPLDTSEAIYPDNAETWTAVDPQGVVFGYQPEQGVALPINDEQHPNQTLDDYADPE